MSPKHIAALIVASFATGCAVGPDYVRPDVLMPEQGFFGTAGVPAWLEICNEGGQQWQRCNLQSTC